MDKLPNEILELIFIQCENAYDSLKYVNKRFYDISNNKAIQNKWEAKFCLPFISSYTDEYKDIHPQKLKLSKDFIIEYYKMDKDSIIFKKNTTHAIISIKIKGGDFDQLIIDNFAGYIYNYDYRYYKQNNKYMEILNKFTDVLYPSELPLRIVAHGNKTSMKIIVKYKELLEKIPQYGFFNIWNNRYGQIFKIINESSCKEYFSYSYNRLENYIILLKNYNIDIIKSIKFTNPKFGSNIKIPIFIAKYLSLKEKILNALVLPIKNWHGKFMIDIEFDRKITDELILISITNNNSMKYYNGMRSPRLCK